MHWIEFISKFDLIVIHVSRKANVAIDALSHHINLDPARVAVVSISAKSDLLSTICHT